MSDDDAPKPRNNFFEEEAEDEDDEDAEFNSSDEDDEGEDLEDENKDGFFVEGDVEENEEEDGEDDKPTSKRRKRSRTEEELDEDDILLLEENTVRFSIECGGYMHPCPSRRRCQNGCIINSVGAMSAIHEIISWLFQGQAFKRGGQLKRIKKRTQEEGHEDRSTLEKRVLGVEMGTPSSSMIFKHDDEYARPEPGCSID